MDLPRGIAHFISHNDHKTVYMSAEPWISENLEDWRDNASRQCAIEADEIWTLQWYPATPIGFYTASAPTLEECITWALEIEANAV